MRRERKIERFLRETFRDRKEEVFRKRGLEKKGKGGESCPMGDIYCKTEKKTCV